MSNDKVPGSSYRRPAISGFAIVGVLLIVVVGVAITVSAAQDSSPLLFVYGAFMASLGGVTVVMLILEWRLVRHRPGPRLGTTPDGVPATVMPRASWTVVISAVMLAVLVISSLAAAAITLRRSEWIIGVVLLVFGLWMASYLVPIALGRVTPGGVYLWPDGVTYARDGASWHVRWQDIAGVVPGEPTAVVLEDGAAVQRIRGSLLWWRSFVRAPEGVLGIQTRFLAENPEILTFLILAYKDGPDLRPQLGTPASLEWEILRAT